MMLFVWILLFMIGKKIGADVTYWIVWSMGVGWSVFKYLIDNAQEMEEL